MVDALLKCSLACRLGFNQILSHLQEAPCSATTTPKAQCPQSGSPTHFQKQVRRGSLPCNHNPQGTMLPVLQPPPPRGSMSCNLHLQDSLSCQRGLITNGLWMSTCQCVTEQRGEQSVWGQPLWQSIRCEGWDGAACQKHPWPDTRPAFVSPDWHPVSPGYGAMTMPPLIPQVIQDQQEWCTIRTSIKAWCCQSVTN